MLGNEGDIFETLYNYAVIEKIEEGLYQYDTEPKWYQMDYELGEVSRMDKRPEFARNIVGWAIG